jgi:hypothetical protein
MKYHQVTLGSKILKIPRPSAIRVRLPSSAPKVAPGRRKSTGAGREFTTPSRKKQRGKLAPCGDRRRIDRPTGVEKLQQLLARAIVVPGPVAFDDCDQLGGHLVAPVLGIEEDGEIEPCLMVAGIGRDLSHNRGSIADGGGLSGEVERRSGGNDRVVALVYFPCGRSIALAHASGYS